MTDIPDDILQKIERFCAFQERCTADIYRKMANFQLSDTQKTKIVEYLVANNFLNEERYAEIFVRSKINSGWGMRKITSALRTKKIPDNIINKFCNNIDKAKYNEKIENIAQKWLKTHASDPQRREKLLRHLLSKGYDFSDVLETINTLKISESPHI